MKSLKNTALILCFGALFSSFQSSNTNCSNYSDDEKPYIIVGEMPRFPGGKIAMNRFIAANLSYPFEALKHKIQGKINIEFVS